MSPGLRTIDDLDVEGKRVLLRADLDVPLIDGPARSPARVADDARIQAALVTIEELRRRGARLVLVSHLGRPYGPDPHLSMRPVAERLETLTGVAVPLAPAVVGPQVVALTRELVPGAMLMVENVRFEAGETDNAPELASALCELADLYVDDAFAGVERAHASTEGVAHCLPSAAGRLIEREVLALRAIVDEPARPLVAILGGAAVSEKVAVTRRLLELADAVCIGGEMSIPFLAACGHGVGRSPSRSEDVDAARGALDAAGAARLELPRDLRLAESGDEGSVMRVLDGVEVPSDCSVLDIGPKTAARYGAKIEAAATVFWSGPMGRFEPPPFDGGTAVVADAVASTSATTVVAGEETVKALWSYGLQDHVSHISTGGPATLKFLEGRPLPGLDVLQRAAISLAQSG